MSNSFRTFFALLLIGQGVYALSPEFTALTKAVVEAAPSRLQALAQADSYGAQAKGLDKRYWPQVTASTGYQYTNSPVNVFMQKLGERNFAASDFDISHLNHPSYRGDAASDITVGGLLWEGGQLSWQRHAMEKLQTAKKLEAKALEGTILVRWSELNLQAVQATATLGKTKNILTALKSDLGEAQKLEEQGVVLGADVAAAKAIAAGVEAFQSRTHVQLEGIKAQLAELAGGPVETFAALELKEETAPAATTLHASVLSAQSATAAAQDETTASRRGSGVRVKWAVSEEYHAGDKAEGAATTASIMATWSLFDLQQASRVAASNAQHRAAQAAQTAAERANKAAKEELTSQVAALKAELLLMDTAVDELSKSLEQIQPLYKEGRKSIADVAQLQQRIVEVSAQRNTAAAMLTGTQVALMEANGGLDLNTYLSLWK